MGYNLDNEALKDAWVKFLRGCGYILLVFFWVGLIGFSAIGLWKVILYFYGLF